MIEKLIKKEESIKNIPLELRDFLKNPKTLKKLNFIIDKFSFTKEQEAKVADLFLDVFLGKIEIYNLLTTLPKDLNITMEEAMLLSDELYKNLFIDLENVINAQHAAYNASNPEGKNIIEKKEKKIVKNRNDNNTTLLDDFIKNSGITFSSDRLKKRFYDVCFSYLNNARTKNQFMDVLVRGEKAGGLAFDNAMINQITTYLSNFINKEELESKKSKEESIPQKSKLKESTIREGSSAGIKVQLPKQQTEQLSKTSVIKKDEVDFKKEEREVEKEKEDLKKTISLTEGDIKEELKKPFVKNTKDDVSIKKDEEGVAGRVDFQKINKSTKELVDKILVDINIDFPSTELNDRFKILIESILREVRTSAQVLERLILDIKSGGLGMGKDEADKLFDKINVAIKKETGDVYFEKLNEIKHFDKKERELVLEKKINKTKDLEKNLDDRYKKLTFKNGKVAKIEKANKLKAEKLDKSKNSEVKALPKTSKVPIEEDAPYFNIPKSENGRPILEDIKFKSKLSGPMEEIARFGLGDMRKLSKDPKEALLKIKDKINLLRSDSFTKYEEAKAVWLKSPLYSEYLEVLDQSLSSELSINDVLKERNTLTQAEFNAIMNVGIE